jgi:hypothetical protein
LLDFIKVADNQIAKQYYTAMATTQEVIYQELTRLAELTKRFCVKALQGDSKFFAELEGQHKLWMAKYWFEMNAKQLRVQAHEAFRLGEYSKAVELYKQIQPVLSPAELKKLDFAEKH